jgi:thiol-disulfide isomerase/thioredoxin
MVSLGPFSLSLVVLLVAVAIAALVARIFSPPASAKGALKPASIIVDMLLVGVGVARAAFVLAWWPQYVADPWTILRIGDGGFLVWAGVLAGLAFGAWRAHKQPGLRRPLLAGTTAGLASWAVLGGALLLMQQSTLRLPAAELGTMDGGSTRLSAMTGKPMVLNLWATWCGPCRREMPVLAKAQALRDDVNFVFANQGESGAQIRDYLSASRLPLDNVLMDPASAVSQHVGSRGLPTTLFFDAEGRLVDTHVGELSEAGLAAKLRRFGPAPSVMASAASRE